MTWYVLLVRSSLHQPLSDLLYELYIRLGYENQAPNSLTDNVSRLLVGSPTVYEFANFVP